MTAIQKTNGWLNLLRDSSSGGSNPKITYVSLGTGTTPPTIGDTQLQAEVFRKAVSSYSVLGTGEILIGLYLGPTDAVGVDIEEVGFWAGSATSALNSGTLVARGLWSHNSKTNVESIVFQLDEVVS